MVYVCDFFFVIFFFNCLLYCVWMWVCAWVCVYASGRKREGLWSNQNYIMVLEYRKFMQKKVLSHP